MKFPTLRHSLLFVCACVLSFALLGSMTFPSQAIASPQPLILDTFDTPDILSSRVATGSPNTPSATINIPESNLSIFSGARDTILTMYENPLKTLAAVTVGKGNLSVTQGTKARAETTVAYGSFTHPDGNPKEGGPFMGLDLSGYKNLQVDFSGAEKDMNINITYHTTKPLTPKNYYTNTGLNVSPSAPNAPLSFKLPMHDPVFNWKSVDGIALLINRGVDVPSTSYTLDTLTFVP